MFIVREHSLQATTNRFKDEFWHICYSSTTANNISIVACFLCGRGATAAAVAAVALRKCECCIKSI